MTTRTTAHTQRHLAGLRSLIGIGVAAATLLGGVSLWSARPEGVRVGTPAPAAGAAAPVAPVSDQEMHHRITTLTARSGADQATISDQEMHSRLSAVASRAAADQAAVSDQEMYSRLVTSAERA